VTVAIPTYNRSGWLRLAVASALSQTYAGLVVVVADNASTDDTEELINSIDDPRVEYVRRRANLGAQENANRLLAAVSTEFVVLLPDDDLLYPRHLEVTVGALDAYPTAGVVDTGFDFVDEGGRVLLASHRRFRAKRTIEFEDRTRFRRRAMADHWPVHFSSALMRTEAANDAGRFRPEDFPPDDFGLFLRMSKEWDVLHVNTCLGAFRIHGASATADYGSFDDTRYEQPLSHFEQIRDIRLRTIEELGVSQQEARALRRAAENAHRRAIVTERAVAASNTGERFPGIRSVWALSMADRGVLVTPRAWRLVAADLGGRRLAREVRTRRRRRANGSPGSPNSESAS
jgi:glycosyltransferase involved in cell wall biosynthesis